jgi:hypothetical protein
MRKLAMEQLLIYMSLLEQGIHIDQLDEWVCPFVSND